MCACKGNEIPFVTQLTRMWHESFICDKCFAWYVCMWHDTFVCDVTRFIETCVCVQATKYHSWQNSHAWDMNHLYATSVLHDTCVCDMTWHVCVWHDSTCLCVTWHVSMWHDTFLWDMCVCTGNELPFVTELTLVRHESVMFDKWFGEYSLFYKALVQKRPMFWGSLLILATSCVMRVLHMQSFSWYRVA